MNDIYLSKNNHLTLYISFRMKSIISLFLVLGITFSASAQENEFKAKPGQKAIEINTAPFSSNPIRVDRIKIRSFGENNRVNRYGFTLNTRILSPAEDVTQNVVEIQFAPGTEKHRDITDRLSAYTGFEGLFGAKFSWYKDNSGSQDLQISGAIDDLGSERAYLQLGGNFLIGADYYLVKNLYLGVELGYGLVYTRFSDIKVEIDGDEVGEAAKGGSTFQMGTTYNSMFRLGFAF